MAPLLTRINDPSFRRPFGEELKKSSEYLTGVGTRTATDFQDMMDIDALDVAPIERHKAATTLDGEAPWTCTPGSALIVPDQDQLFDRKKHPFQLRNVIDEHPEIAKKLSIKLMDYMSDLAE